MDLDDYSYYFREGFRRGYEDGYAGRYQYGRYVNGSYSLLDVVLSQGPASSRFIEEPDASHRRPTAARTVVENWRPSVR